MGVVIIVVFLIICISNYIGFIIYIYIQFVGVKIAETSRRAITLYICDLIPTI